MYIILHYYFMLLFTYRNIVIYVFKLKKTTHIQIHRRYKIDKEVS